MKGSLLSLQVSPPCRSFRHVTPLSLSSAQQCRRCTSSLNEKAPSLSPSRIARTMGIIDSSDDVDKEGQLAATDNEAVRATEEERGAHHYSHMLLAHKSQVRVHRL